MSAPLGMTVQMDVPFDIALVRTREALKAEGFGVLTEIDIRAAFKEKLGQDFRPYVILGACNPPLAHRALSADAEIGLLLPCNVTVEAGKASGSVVRLIDPVSMMAVAVPGGSPVIRDVAAEAQRRLARVAHALGHPAPPAA